DWSSDVCSSDLVERRVERQPALVALDHSRRLSLAGKLQPQRPLAEGVEGGDPERRVALIERANDPLAHLVGGFAGEGERKDLIDPGVAVLDQVDEAGRQRGGLAGARPGDDPQRRAAMAHGAGLLFIEAGDALRAHASPIAGVLLLRRGLDGLSVPSCAALRPEAPGPKTGIRSSSGVFLAAFTCTDMRQWDAREHVVTRHPLVS